MSLIEKLKKQSKIKGASYFDDSELFQNIDPITTPVPMINVAFSGELDGGIVPGHTMFAGESKRFKSLFALLCAAAYLKKYDDAVLIFYDSEFGTPKSYFKNLGIDTSRVIHIPVMNIEELKFDLINQLDNIDRKEHVMILIDSLGMIASKKELDDAKDEKSVADMTRAKAMKSLFRMATPYLRTKNIPLITINHTYKTLDLFSKDIVSGGTGAYLAADNIWVIGRRQNKVGTEVQGYHFVIKIEKSRFTRENVKIPISVTFDKGISRWSGLLELAMEAGYVFKPKNGWYAKCDPTAEFDPETKKPVPTTKSMREVETNTAEFWKPILEDESFKTWIRNKYKLTDVNMIEDDNDKV